MIDFWIGSGQIALTFGYAFIGIAVFVLALALLREEQSRAAEQNLDFESDAGQKVSPLLRTVRPILRQSIIPFLQKKKWTLGKVVHYKRKLISGGLRRVIAPEELIALKFVLVPLVPIFFFGLRAIEVVDFSSIFILLLGTLGWFAPDIFVELRIRARQKLVRKSMPFVIDLLALSTEAGLDFIGAMQRVVEKAKMSPLIEELDQVLREIRIGSSRSEALKEMAIRIGMQEINSFVAILISAEQMGASIGKILRNQSEQIRIQRFIAAERAGALAAQSLMFPVVFIIMPAVLLMVIGPVVLEFVRGGGFGT